MIRYSIEFSNLKKGFLLIEVLIYLALFGIIVGGSVSVFYSLLESSEKVNKDALVSNEAEFILGKINWMLSGSVIIEEPSPGESGNKLSLVKNNFPDNPLVLEKVDDDILLQRGGDEANILNNSLIRIEDLNFENIIVPTVPEQNILRASFVIASTTYHTSRLIHE
ncbi:MAG: prepilin-type N-terminal cleavage/methylation domain-containing protein [Patescibacteria group bacterium]